MQSANSVYPARVEFMLDTYNQDFDGLRPFTAASPPHLPRQVQRQPLLASTNQRVPSSSAVA